MINSLGAFIACKLQFSEPFSALGPLHILLIYGKRFLTAFYLETCFDL